jgi:uncharacterized protein YcfL
MLIDRKKYILGLTLVASLTLTGCAATDTTPTKDTKETSVNVEASEGEASLNSLETILENSKKKAAEEGVIETGSSIDGTKTVMLYNPKISETNIVVYNEQDGLSSAALESSQITFISGISYEALVEGYNTEGVSLEGNTSGVFTFVRGEEKILINTDGKVITSVEFTNAGETLLNLEIKYGEMSKEQVSKLEEFAKLDISSIPTEETLPVE